MDGDTGTDGHVAEGGLGTMSGRVVSVGDVSFEADLVDADDVVSVEGLSVDLDRVAPDDLDKVRVGAAFTLHEGEEGERGRIEFD